LHRYISHYLIFLLFICLQHSGCERQFSTEPTISKCGIVQNRIVIKLAQHVPLLELKIIDEVVYTGHDSLDVLNVKYQAHRILLLFKNEPPNSSKRGFYSIAFKRRVNVEDVVKEYELLSIIEIAETIPYCIEYD
jgi:hypothetical protein